MLIYKVLYGTVRGVLEHNAGLVGAIAVKESTANREVWGLRRRGTLLAAHLDAFQGTRGPNRSDRDRLPSGL